MYRGLMSDFVLRTALINLRAMALLLLLLLLTLLAASASEQVSCSSISASCMTTCQ